MGNGNGHTALWEAARFVDPKHTKEFARFGGFRGRATNATYLMRRATEVFGPAGIGWGWNIIDEKYTSGAPILSSEGVVLGNEIIHSVRVKLWFSFNEKRGEVEHFGQTQFVGKNKNGLFTDEEAPKKSLTDAITKALSCLGFAADIHMGLWDDSKYVAQMIRDADQQNGGSMVNHPFGLSADPASNRFYREPSSLTQQLKDSVAAESKKKNFDTPALPEHANDPRFHTLTGEDGKIIDLFKKTTEGLAWKRTACKEAVEPLFHDLDAAQDLSELMAVPESQDNKLRLEICKLAVPIWESEFYRRFNLRREELYWTDDPSRHIRA